MTADTMDRRRLAARPDLAASSLRGTVEAARFVEGQAMQVRRPSLAMRRAPSPDAPIDTEAVHGETIQVFDRADGWAWGQIAADGYVGYVETDGLASDVTQPTHRVAVLRTFAYAAASIKSPSATGLSLGALVTIVETAPPFARTATGHFVWADHLASLDAPAADFVAVAEQFIGTPYLWGGKTSIGLDCSGLVQVSLAASGIKAPRDSDMQERETGEPVAFDDPKSLRRGDLVFWRGHVGILRDADTLLHAAGHCMTVVSEPFALAQERIEAAGAGPVRTVRRVRS